MSNIITSSIVYRMWARIGFSFNLVRQTVL
jgi:hypothetical protein